jgi:sulfite reductase alpha subunit-like flavoprotein
MITPSDSFYTYDLGKYFTILPTTPKWKVNDFIQKFGAKKVPEGFAYNSETNSDWESVQSLRALIKQHVDPNFGIQ